MTFEEWWEKNCDRKTPHAAGTSITVEHVRRMSMRAWHDGRDQGAKAMMKRMLAEEYALNERQRCKAKVSGNET